MVIRNNLSANHTVKRLSASRGRMEKHCEKLASGYRINRSADNAAGLSISERMRRQIRGGTRASVNAQNGISLIQSAEGALKEVAEILQRANVLAIQSANGTNTETERKSIQEEFNHLKQEIDRVASTTTFNQIGLLDGSLGRKGATKTAAVQNTAVFAPDDGTTEITGKKVSVLEIQVIQEPFDVKTQPGNDNLKKALQQSIVPQAVEKMLQTFGNTFGYLRGSNIGMGLGLGSTSSAMMAAVRAGLTTFHDHTTQALTKAQLSFTLLVNTDYLKLDANSPDGLTPESRKALEHTISHEMMHAMMHEALSAGMLDTDAEGDIVEGFPKWFVEGTAQAACGGMEWMPSMGIHKNSTEEEITAVLAGNNRLGQGTTTALYGTGYLAVMYLGSLAGGGSDVASVANGVDRILLDIRRGKSLDEAIAAHTPYTGTDDFQAKFAGDSAAFVKNLIAAAGNGTGGLITGDYTSADLLPNENRTPDVFHLNTDIFEVNNHYPNGHVVLSGGTKSRRGLDYNGQRPTDPPPKPPYPSVRLSKPADPPAPLPNQPADPPDSPTPPSNQPADPLDPPAPLPNQPADPPDSPTPPSNQPADPLDPPTPPPNPPTQPIGQPDPPASPINLSAADRGHKGGITLQVGADSESKMVLHIEAMNTAALGIEATDMSTAGGAAAAIDSILKAIERVSAQRTDLGAYQNRLEHTVRNLDNMVENTQSAESLLRDTDMAKEMLGLTRERLLLHVGEAMLAQANQRQQDVLLLLS